MKKYINVVALGVGLISSLSAYADYKGVLIGSKQDPYWFQINGAIQLDQRIFMGNKQGLHTGAYVRKFDLDLTGNLNKDLSFTAGVGFNAAKSQVSVNDLYITYTGFQGLGENFHISIGKVNPSFCLENSSSSKWIPFLERSIATSAFSPDPGLGISINKWQKDYSVNITVTQPKPNDYMVDADNSNNKIEKSDRWQINTRLTKAHFFGENKLAQIGFSGHIKDDNHSGVEFSTAPEASSRYRTSMLLNTTINGKRIKAKSHYSLGLELLGQNGPFSFQAEGLLNKVNRDKTQSSNNLNFKGYYANINYVLTGEAREFKSNQGVFGKVVPAKDSGAWEISGRYSFLDLNSKDILGGRDRGVGVATTWYANYYIAVTAEYMKHYVKKQATLQKQNFDSVGARLQLVF